jgi:hypothetical protein
MITGKTKTRQKFLKKSRKLKKEMDNHKSNSNEHSETINFRKALSNFHFPIKHKLKMLIEIESENPFYRDLVVPCERNFLTKKQINCIVSDFNKKILSKKVK